MFITSCFRALSQADRPTTPHSLAGHAWNIPDLRGTQMFKLLSVDNKMGFQPLPPPLPELQDVEKLEKPSRQMRPPHFLLTIFSVSICHNLPCFPKKKGDSIVYRANGRRGFGSQTAADPLC